MTTQILSASRTISKQAIAGAVCLFLGMAIIFVVGLSPMAAAHNTAHDTRHAIGFPCH